jgi:hypothetical protein
MPKYRTFVSYCSKDKDLVNRVVSALKEIDHNVEWDQVFETGFEFPQQIRSKIECAHFFMPVNTENASASSWVQQEIGYAVACGIPIVPIGFGPDGLPKGLIGQIQASLSSLSIEQSDLLYHLKIVDWKGLLKEAGENYKAVFRCESDATKRATTIADNAMNIAKRLQNGNGLVVMQQSTLSSFGLPTHTHNENWIEVRDREEFHWFQPAESYRLIKLAKHGECNLIIDPCFSRAVDPGKGKMASWYRADIQRARLKTLADFLKENVNNIQLRIVIQKFTQSDSETIIDDHWMCHSASVVTLETERESISTWHAPTVQRYRDSFLRQFNTLFNEQESNRDKTLAKTSVDYAIARINCAIEKLCQGNHVKPRCSICKFDSTTTCGECSST